MIKGQHSRKARSVCQYSMTGQLIKKHFSMSLASHSLGKDNSQINNISQNLIGYTLSADGFIWFDQLQDDPVYANTERFVNHKI
jgi:hypothetical protein